MVFFFSPDLLEIRLPVQGNLLWTEGREDHDVEMVIEQAQVPVPGPVHFCIGDHQIDEAAVQPFLQIGCHIFEQFDLHFRIFFAEFGNGIG